MSESQFVLRVTPPRLPRLAMARPRLERFWQQAQDATAVAVVAPAGFGKATLLLQWRRAGSTRMRASPG